MTNRSMLWGRVRLALEILLGACTLWLVVQNLALLTMMPWKEVPALMIAATAVVRAGWLVLREMWPLTVFAVITASIIMATLASRGETRNTREARHA